MGSPPKELDASETETTEATETPKAVIPCPLSVECNFISTGEVKQTGQDEFQRETECQTHNKKYYQTFSAVGFYVIKEDGSEGEFIHTR